MLMKKVDPEILLLVQTWVQDFVNIGMSYSRISKRLNFSPSTIQKIVHKKRMPRLKTIIAIGEYYLKIFSNPQNYGHVAATYYLINATRIDQTLDKTKKILAQIESSLS